MNNNQLSHKPWIIETFYILFLLIPTCLFYQVYRIQYVDQLPNALTPMNDAGSYWKMGLAIFRDGWLLPNHGPYYQAPLYSYWLALHHVLGIHRIADVLFIQVWLGVANVLITYAMARFYLERSYAFGAALLFAFCHYSFFYTTKLVATTLGITLFLLFICLFLWWLKREHLIPLVASAIALSLAILCRPNLLFTVPFLLLLFIQKGKRGEDNKGTLFVPIVNLKMNTSVFIFLLVLILGVSTATLRNALIAGDPVPLSANSGVTLYMGTNEHAEGGLAPVEGLSNDIDVQHTQSIELASQAVGRSLSASEASGYWINKTISWVMHHPIDFLILECKKILWALYHAPPSVNYSSHFEGQWVTSIRFLQWLTWLSLFGGLLYIPTLVMKRDGPSRLLLAILGGYLLLSLVYYASDRFLAALLPLTSIMTLLGLQTHIRQKINPFHLFVDHKKYLLWIAIVFFLTLNPFLRSNRIQEIGIGWYNLGVFYEEQSQETRAIECYQTAIELIPDYPSALLNLGVLYAKQADLQRSSDLFQRVLKIDPGNEQAKRNLRINRQRVRTP